MKIRILGSGSSGGVPRVGTGWGACDPNEPKNRRTRCSILIESNTGKRCLIDTAPDMREQLLACDVHYLDAVFYTHAHADQAHGIDDLRGIAMVNHARVPVYANEETAKDLGRRFDYCFQSFQGYPAILDMQVIDAPVDVDDMRVIPVPVPHGLVEALGFRIGNAAYFPDLSDLPKRALDALQGLEVLIIDALRYKPHPSHLTVAQALAFSEIVRPKTTILTNLHQDLDYQTLIATLPPGVIPAYDGMEIKLQ